VQHSWTGSYINLDRSGDRRASIEGQLQRAGISHLYSRFPAIDGAALPASGSRLTPGAIGCFESHAAILAHPGRSGSFVHILEDDAVIPASFPGHVERLIGSGGLDVFDIIYTDIIIARFDHRDIRKLKAAFDIAMASEPDIALQLVDLRGFPFAGTTSYFLTPAGISKVGALVGKEREAGPSLPIDLFYRREVNAGRLRAACIFPFVTSVDHSGASTVTEQKPGASASAEIMASRMARYSFFVDRDLSVASAALAPLTAPTVGDRHLNLLADIYRILISTPPHR
jgi:GR25 family glycosyltransferase involved in LPS biosynthesis